jgi:hypothetical protein
MACYVGSLTRDDEYMTPKSAWEEIHQLIPKGKVIWEAFYGDGKSGTYLRELGFEEVIHEPIDFFEHDLGDIVVSNPPFSLKKQVLERLVSLDKPFILLMPIATLATTYCRRLFERRGGLRVVLPKKRIQFVKNGETTSRCNFETAYFLYKIDVPDGVTFWVSPS